MHLFWLLECGRPIFGSALKVCLWDDTTCYPARISIVSIHFLSHRQFISDAFHIDSSRRHRFGIADIDDELAFGTERRLVLCLVRTGGLNEVRTTKNILKISNSTIYLHISVFFSVVTFEWCDCPVFCSLNLNIFWFSRRNKSSRSIGHANSKHSFWCGTPTTFSFFAFFAAARMLQLRRKFGYLNNVNGILFSLISLFYGRIVWSCSGQSLAGSHFFSHSHSCALSLSCALFTR